MKRRKCKVKNCFKKSNLGSVLCNEHDMKLRLAAIRVLNQQNKQEQ